MNKRGQVRHGTWELVITPGGTIQHLTFHIRLMRIPSEIKASEDTFTGRFEYLTSENSLLYVPDERPAVSSGLIVNDLQIALDSDNFIVGIDGYIPNSNWLQYDLELHNLTHGKLVVDNSFYDAELNEGFTKRLTSPNECTVRHDTTCSLIHVGVDLDLSHKTIKFATGQFAVVNENNEIVGFYLQPEFI